MDDEPASPPDEPRPVPRREAADPTEVVRIIGVEEAAEAIDRGDVTSRRGSDQLRLGDRPGSPPTEPRPTMSVPLDVGSSAAHREHPAAQPSPEPVTGPGGLSPETEPPTGEIPAVLIEEDAPPVDGSDDDLDAWSSFATSAPRWRDAEEAGNEDDTEFVASPAHGERSPLGPVAHETPSEDLERRVEPKPPWASVPDADDFHDATTMHEEQVVERELAVGPQPDGATASGAAGRSSRVYDADQDDEGDTGSVDAAAGGSTRLARRKARRSQSKGGSGPAEGSGRDVRTAVVVGVLLLAVFAGLMYIGPGWAMILVALVVFLAGGEYFDALRKAGFESATLFGIAGCVAFPLAVYWRGLTAFPLLSVLAVAGCLIWFLAGAGGPGARVIEGTGTTLLGIAWVGGLGSFAASMLRAPDGRALLVIAALATVAYDVGGFFVGRKRGHRPLSEASPNKTVEGLAGGMALCVVVTVVIVGVAKLGPYTGYRAGLLVGVVAGVAAPLGDLCQSLIKRDLGVKDMSAILPGHGGVFDRFDALLFVLPAVYYVVTIIGHRI